MHGRCEASTKIHRRPRIGSAPLGIGQATIEVLEGWLDSETLVGPSVCRATVAKINETTLLDLITKSINTPKIRPTRT